MSLYLRNRSISSDLVMLILRYWLLQSRARICFFPACLGSSVQDYCKISVRTFYIIECALKYLLAIVHIHTYYAYLYVHTYANVNLFLGNNEMH